MQLSILKFKPTFKKLPIPCRKLQKLFNVIWYFNTFLNQNNNRNTTKTWNSFLNQTVDFLCLNQIDFFVQANKFLKDLMRHLS